MNEHTGAHGRQSAEDAIAQYRAWAEERHADNPELARKMIASFSSFARRAEEILAEDPNARFAMVEFQPLAAHARPSQQHFKQLEADGYKVIGVSGEKGQGFARQHYMEQTYVAGKDWLAEPATQDALLRVRAQEGNDAFNANLYPKFAAEQAAAMYEGVAKMVEFLGSNLDVIAGDVSSGTAALLQERFGEELGIKRFAIDNGLGPGYEMHGPQTNAALNEVRREVGLPEKPVDGPAATCTGEGGVLTPFAPGVLYERGGEDLALRGFKYVDPVRKGDAATSAEPKPVFPGEVEGPLFYGTGTSSGGTSPEIAPLLHDHNMAMIEAFRRLGEERGARTLIAVGKGKMDEYAHLADQPGITVVTDPSVTGYQGTEPGVTLVEFADQIGAYREISQSIADGQGGGVVSHGGAGTIKEATSDKLPAPMEVMGFPTFADQQYNIQAMVDRGVFLGVQGDTVEEWTESIYNNAIEMLDNPGARAEAIAELRAELDAQPPLGEVYREFLDGPYTDPTSGPAGGPLPAGPSGGSSDGGASGAEGDSSESGGTTAGSDSGTTSTSGSSSGSDEDSGTTGASQSGSGGTAESGNSSSGSDDTSDTSSDTSGGSDANGSTGDTAVRESVEAPDAPAAPDPLDTKPQPEPEPVEEPEPVKEEPAAEEADPAVLAEGRKAAEPPAPVEEHKEPAKPEADEDEAKTSQFRRSAARSMADVAEAPEDAEAHEAEAASEAPQEAVEEPADDDVVEQPEQEPEHHAAPTPEIPEAPHDEKPEAVEEPVAPETPEQPAQPQEDEPAKAEIVAETAAAPAAVEAAHEAEQPKPADEQSAPETPEAQPAQDDAERRQVVEDAAGPETPATAETTAQEPHDAEQHPQVVEDPTPLETPAEEDAPNELEHAPVEEVVEPDEPAALDDPAEDLEAIEEPEVVVEIEPPAEEEPEVVDEEDPWDDDFDL